MGPANDYWPADLGGTTRTRLVHVLMYVCVIRACAYMCVCVRERQGPRLALAVPRRPHEPLVGTFWTFSPPVARAILGRRAIFQKRRSSRTNRETKRIIAASCGKTIIVKIVPLIKSV